MFTKFIDKKVESASFWLDRQPIVKESYKIIFMTLELYILSEFYYRFLCFIIFILLKDNVFHPFHLFNFTVSTKLILSPSLHEMILYVSAIAVSFKVKDDNVSLAELKKIKNRKMNLFIFLVVFFLTIILSKLVLPNLSDDLVLKNKYISYFVVLLVISGFWTFINIFTSYTEAESQKHLSSWKRVLTVMVLIFWSLYTEFDYKKCVAGNKSLVYVKRSDEFYDPCKIKLK